MNFSDFEFDIQKLIYLFCKSINDIKLEKLFSFTIIYFSLNKAHHKSTKKCKISHAI